MSSNYNVFLLHAYDAVSATKHIPEVEHGAI
jgi:hypothetical protein